MLATLQMIREKYGGPEGYVLEKCGLSMDDIQNIRANLVVEMVPLHRIPPTST